MSSIVVNTCMIFTLFLATTIIIIISVSEKNPGITGKVAGITGRVPGITGKGYLVLLVRVAGITGKVHVASITGKGTWYYW